jgi:hypothetical protein
MGPDDLIMEGLYCFSHEEYQFNGDQPFEDFLTMTNKCIADRFMLP